jgi:hypothetical protein
METMLQKKKLLISFSGGLTSAYMTYRLFQELNPDEWETIVVFANTGKEREETLEFVRNCDDYFGFNTVWVECITNPRYRKGVSAKVVDFNTASRNGEPFKESIRKHGIPNTQMAMCTRELKTRTIEAYLKSIGWKNGEYYRAIGIRIDEIDRINENYKKLKIIYPCISMFPSRREDVNAFWIIQPFTLNLKSYQGNCDCCLKKSLRKLLTIAVEEPERFEWYADIEDEFGMFVPENRNYKPDKPQTFFRNNLSAMDILEMSKGFKDFARDESGDIIRNEQLCLFGNELDVSNGCSESCEPF